MNCKLLLLDTLAARLAASPTPAQTFYIHGNPGLLNSTTFSAGHNADLNARVGAGIPVSSRVEVHSDDRFNARAANGETVSSYSALAP